jgi:hypothetical protein
MTLPLLPTTVRSRRAAPVPGQRLPRPSPPRLPPAVTGNIGRQSPGGVAAPKRELLYAACCDVEWGRRTPRAQADFN